MKSNHCTLIIVTIALLFSFGCGSSTRGTGSTAASIQSFVATPAIVSTGQSTILSWAVNGATTLTLTSQTGSGPIQTIDGTNSTTVSSTSVSVTPSATTTYTLSATDSHGKVISQSIPVTVVAAPAIMSFSLATPIIASGQSTTLNWTVTGATTLTIEANENINGQTGGDHFTTLDPSVTSMTVNPSVSAQYTLTASNAQPGLTTSATTSKSIVLQVVQTPQINSFTATPATVSAGHNSTTLSWSVSNATALSIDQGIGAVTGTSVTVSPTETTTYTLTASNTVSGFTATSSAQAVVTYSAVPLPSAYLNVSAPSTGPNGSVNLIPIFNAVGGTASIDQGIGTVTNNLAVSTGSLSASTNFTLTATNLAGSASSETRVLVGDIALYAGYPSSAGFSDGTVDTVSSGGAVTYGTARFHSPDGMALDSSGNLYVADTINNTIREIASDGSVSTLAGVAGTSGSTDSQNGTPLFNGPTGIAVDAAGNVYVADTGNDTIRKIASNGNVTTLAGVAGTPGSTDSADGTPLFSGPTGIAFEPLSGNLYVADSGGHTIRLITPAGVVSTFAGVAGEHGSDNGTGTNAKFNGPFDVALDNAGNLYVTDQLNYTIRKITPAGMVTTFAGTVGVPGSVEGSMNVDIHGNEMITTAQFQSPRRITVDADGYVYVTDYKNFAVRRISADGVTTGTIIGTPGKAYPSLTFGALPAKISYPQGIALNPKAGSLYLSLSTNALYTAPF